MSKIQIHELKAGLTVYDANFNFLDYFPNVVKKINEATKRPYFVYTNSKGEEKVLMLAGFPHIYKEYVKANSETLSLIENESEEQLFYVDGVKMCEKIKIKNDSTGFVQVLKVERQNSHYIDWYFSVELNTKLQRIAFKN